MIHRSTEDASAISGASTTAYVVAGLFVVVPVVTIAWLVTKGLELGPLVMLTIALQLLPALLLARVGASLRAFSRAPAGDEQHLLAALRRLRLYVVVQGAFALYGLVWHGIGYAMGSLVP